MSKLYIKFYDEYDMIGQDFPPLSQSNMRRVVFSPDGRHSVAVVKLSRDGTLLLTNEAMVSFDFTITRSRRVLAVIRYNAEASTLAINNNWRMQGDTVENCVINENPDLHVSPHLNFNISGEAILRVDVKVDDSAFACMVFAEKDLLFVRMNGNHAYPRLVDVIGDEVRKATSDESVISILNAKEQLKKKVWKRLFSNWFFNGFF